MIHDYWRIAHRSQDSAGKSAVRMQYFGRSTVDENYMKNPIFPEDEGSQKGEPRGPEVGPPHRPARPKAWPRRPVRRGPQPPLASFSSRTPSSRKPKLQRIPREE